MANRRKPRFIITRGVIDMATSQVLRNEGYMYAGPVASADENENTVTSAVNKALEKHFDKVKETLTAYETQLKDNGRVTEKIKETIADLNKDGGKLVSDVKDTQQAHNQRILELEQKLTTLTRAGVNGPAERKTIGVLFTESEQLKSFLGKDGRGPSKGSSERFEVKTITSLPGSGGPGIFPEYLPTPVIPAFMPLTIRDLLAEGTTGSNMVIWVQENVFTDNAGYQGSEGALKPMSDITYVQKNVAIATLAHYIRASKQVLSDFPLLSTLINTRLTFGLKLSEEREILFGDGATNHLHGLVPQATAYNAALNRNGDQMLDVLRHAMLQVQLAFYPSTGIALSPHDWHDIELLKDGFHRYLFSNPAGSIPAMVWGLPVAQCYSLGSGDFLVGAFKLAATLLDRQESSILVSTEDQDNFVRNLVTILAEERLALAVSRPAAIIWGNFPSGSST